jgi:V/A-type H+/Na+-transporting ATPase subunit E
MNCEELIESLWQEAENKISVIIRETGEEETRIINEALLKISRLREDSQKRCSSASRKLTEGTLSEAEKKARLITIAEDLRLSERLYRISQASLRTLRNRDYQGSFRNMAEELPLLTWKTVRINPGDAGLARKYFPDAAIITDESISGGMEVMTDDGKIRVINTLEKRLERAWGDIIPHIMKEFYGTV